jgi:rhodanese-related sulfurtransferase
MERWHEAVVAGLCQPFPFCPSPGKSPQKRRRVVRTGVKKILLGVAGLVLVAVSVAAAEDFPLRAKYPQTKPISTEELVRSYERAIVVDVRSDIEYDVAHINRALHIPIALSNFVKELEKVRSKGGAEPMAFYCNGYHCAKSYQAAVAAMDAGFGNVFVYDAGIYDWINAHPEKATLMGKTPAAKEKLISEEAFNRRKIGYEEFARKAGAPNTAVIDIREPFQRAKDPQLPQNRHLTLPNLRNIPSDRLVPLLKAKEFKGQQLLITDAVGKQVQWLQYYLEEEGYTNYCFLNNGVLGAAEASGVK